MNKEIFIALCDLLEKEVPEIRWIDEDSGQLNTQMERPAVDFPCCLIDIQYPDCKDMSETEQLINATITLKLAFQPSGDTNNKVPEDVRSKALQRFSIIEKVQSCMQGWTADEMISPVSRKSAKGMNTGKIKPYTIVYTTTFTEVQT